MKYLLFISYHIQHLRLAMRLQTSLSFFLVVSLLLTLIQGCNEAPATDATPETPAATTVSQTATPTSLPTETPVPTTTQTASATPSPAPTLTATSTPTLTPTPTHTPTATPIPPTHFTVTLEKLCVYTTGDVPFSRADVYFDFQVVDYQGSTFLLKEVLAENQLKAYPDANCGLPLRFGDKVNFQIPTQVGTCFTVQGHFWNANRLWADSLVGKISDRFCYKVGGWSPAPGSYSHHLTGGGADWEVHYRAEVRG